MIADAVLVVHALFVQFVVGGFVLVLVGAGRWSWVQNRTFRMLHLAAIAFVAAEALLGFTCPLTAWEDALRGAGTGRSFVGRWVARLLYYDLPEWVFATAYCAFAVAVIWAWIAIPPRPSRKNNAL
jgi:polyferredoxin